ncbi:MAG: DUF4252 domain-containing protein [Bryobacteraceae bacterium]|nr:DUF4252 domain-containing protein [Bryobacteraceae bacterium]
MSRWGSRWGGRSLCAALLLAGALQAQELTGLRLLDQLEAKASEKVNVTLDGNLLQLAARFLSASDPEQAQVRKVVSKLKAIYVRAFEFDKEGAFSAADVDSLRRELKTPEWSRIVDASSKRDGESSEIYLHQQNGQVTGLAILAYGKKELTVVNIVGPISIEDLAALGGEFGIPKIERNRKK